MPLRALWECFWSIARETPARFRMMCVLVGSIAMSGGNAKEPPKRGISGRCLTSLHAVWFFVRKIGDAAEQFREPPNVDLGLTALWRVHPLSGGPLP